jgi:hypothetical protein
MSSTLVPITRHLKTTSPGRVVGIDYLTLVPDKFGNVGVYVLRDHFTKFVYIMPATTHDQVNASLAIFLYSVLYGAFDVLMSDPGSDLTSQAVAEVNKWFGIHHRLSLVDRHESNGVEGANKQILRYLRKLFLDERVKESWSSPQHVAWAMYLMNKFDDSESGNSPYALTFGTVSNRRFDFPGTDIDVKTSHKYIRALDESLRTLTQLAQKHQQDLVSKRVDSSIPQNLFQRGDLVLFKLPVDKPKPHKLHPRYLGPYEVLNQVKNDVEVRHMSTSLISTFYVADLKAFFGSREDAKKLASIDADQFVIRQLLAFRGDPLLRTSMYFLVEFEDNDRVWLPWSKDLQDSLPYEHYCRLHKCLKPLIGSAADSSKWAASLRRSKITHVRPTQRALIDLRAFGSDWYATLDLPDKDVLTYVVPIVYGALAPSNKAINITSDVLQLSMLVDNVFIQLYGTSEPPSNSISVTPDLIARHPTLLSLYKPVSTDQQAFEYLVGKTFYDPEAKRSFCVTRIHTNPTSKLIVAYVRPILRTGRPAKEDSQPFHVADVVNMLTPSNFNPPATNPIPVRER